MEPRWRILCELDIGDIYFLYYYNKVHLPSEQFICVLAPNSTTSSYIRNNLSENHYSEKNNLQIKG